MGILASSATHCYLPIDVLTEAGPSPIVGGIALNVGRWWWVVQLFYLVKFGGFLHLPLCGNSDTSLTYVTPESYSRYHWQLVRVTNYKEARNTTDDST